MNEFQSMLREAFAGEEPQSDHPARQELEESLRKLERRARLLRVLLWTAVFALTAIAFASAWVFLASDESTSRKSQILSAVLFLWSFTAVGQLKLFLFHSQQNLSIQKEIKRLHLAVLGGRDTGSA